MYRTTIMVVGDPVFCSSVADDIRTGMGLHTTALATAAAARSFLRSGVVDTSLVIVHAGLPDGAGFELCTDLARSPKAPPVMMVGGRNDETETLRSLEAGAIDHFPRPQNRAELLARLRAHLRSQATSLEVEITVGPFTFRPGQRALVDRNTHARIWLTAKESRLLRRLHLANGQPVPSADLIDAAWNSADTSMHTLHTHVYRLRSKLGSGHDGHPMLHTTRGGYALVV